MKSIRSQVIKSSWSLSVVYQLYLVIDHALRGNMANSMQEEQLEFMDLCKMPRYELAYSLEHLHDKAFKAGLSMWAKLIDEECNEELLRTVNERLLADSALTLDEKKREYDIETLTHIADGGIDTIYVVLGMLNYLGIPVQEIWDEVQSTNMAKAVDGKILRRADGKILKPEGWRPPDIKAIIAKHIQEQEHKLRIVMEC